MTTNRRDEARRLASSLAELVRLTQFRGRDRVSALGITPTQGRALECAVAEGAVSVNQLGAHLYVDKSTASRMAATLVDADYLTRVSDPADARTVRLVPTARGRALCAALRADEERDFAMLVEDLGPAQAEVQRAVSALVDRLAQGVEASRGRCAVIR